MHVKKNDTVLVIAGKDRGKRGKVLRVSPRKQRVIVEGVNLLKKNVRANPAEQESGGIRENEASINASNVMVCCPRCNQPVRISRQVLDDGTLVRRCRKCQEMI